MTGIIHKLRKLIVMGLVFSVINGFVCYGGSRALVELENAADTESFLYYFGDFLDQVIDEVLGKSKEQAPKAADFTENVISRNSSVDDLYSLTKNFTYAVGVEGDYDKGVGLFVKDVVVAEIKGKLNEALFGCFGEAAKGAGYSEVGDALKIAGAAGDMTTPAAGNITALFSGQGKKSSTSKVYVESGDINQKADAYFYQHEMEENYKAAYNRQNNKNKEVDGFSKEEESWVRKLVKKLTGETEPETVYIGPGVDESHIEAPSEARAYEAETEGKVTEPAKPKASRQAAGPAPGPGGSVLRGRWWPFGAKQYVREVRVVTGELGGSTRTSEYHYDGSGKLQYEDWSRVHEGKSHGPQSGRVIYECDQNGRWIRSYSNDFGTEEEIYHYDSDGRLIGSEYSFTKTTEIGTVKEYGTIRYEYDQEGKIIRKTDEGAVDEVQRDEEYNYEIHASSIETGTYTYDSNQVLQGYEGSFSQTESYQDIDPETGEEYSDSETYTHSISSSFYY